MDEHIARFAERQHGMFTLAQAEAAGATPQAVRHRLATGRWELAEDRVYRLAGTGRTWEQGLMAVLLAAGPEAVASHPLGGGASRDPRVRTPGTTRVHHPAPAPPSRQ